MDASAALLPAVNRTQPYRNAVKPPYASRMNTYWPPASGNIAPNSAHASPAMSVIPPATTQSASATAGIGIARMTSAGTMKIDGPMVPVTTSMIESKRVSRRTK